jgi:F420-dependent oxidoreductase-like protein
VRLGLHISDFTWAGGAAELRFRLGKIARHAEEAGVDRISVMDHLWQMASLGPPEHEMLEAYTTLGWLAARTERVKLLALVTAVVFRAPGLLAKAVTTLDVLSGGRAILGIGAASNPDESAGLGLPFPPVAERFERLEETLRIVKQMWSAEEGPFDGRHYHLARTLNSPPALSRPHPPILIGGEGEKKTLKLVARHADACNIGVHDLDATARKLDVLRRHCADEGRDYDEIEKTAGHRFDLGEHGENVTKTIEHLHAVAELGITQIHGPLLRVGEPGQLDLLGDRVIPAVAKF